ncbi:unnamed protein product [Bursaphelenchus xylophilus]|uniref:(pine wood nematode) hypothetical protein n=1 Tax=Bursaphelenchus xylophilus TaxID=6326 RepID=A0A1I7SC78_BURXY|nr:unnamed protein product [Bursaphelenchus xylophilus]CAG9094601.1 unnamed protein product [Bursaphelenchus xylophilus]
MSGYGESEYYKDLLDYYVKCLPKYHRPKPPYGMSGTQENLLMIQASREAEKIRGVEDDPFNPKPFDFKAHLAEMEKMERLQAERKVKREERDRNERNQWNNGRGHQNNRGKSWNGGVVVKEEETVVSIHSKDRAHRNGSRETQVMDKKHDNFAEVAGPSFEEAPTEDRKPFQKQIATKKRMERPKQIMEKPPKNPNVKTVLVPDGFGGFLEITRVKVKNPMHSDNYRPKPTKTPALPPVSSDYDKLTPAEKKRRFMKDLNPKAARKNQPKPAPRFVEDSESSEGEDSPAPSTSYNRRRRPRTPVSNRAGSSSESDEPKRKRRPEVIVEEIEVDEADLPPLKAEVKPENVQYVNPLQSLIDFITTPDALTDEVPDFLIPPFLKMHWIQGSGFKNRSIVQMDTALYSALEEAHKTKAKSLFIVEEPLHCLNATLLKKAGAILCKMNHFYRPHYLPDVLEDIPRRLGKSIEHVFITITHNALFNLDMVEDHEPDKELTNTMFHSVDNRKPLADVFENLPKIIKCLVQQFKLKQVVIIVPPTCKSSDLLQRLRNRFIEAIERHKYLQEHVFYADFHGYCRTSDVKPCAAGLQQFLRSYFTIYGDSWLHLRK